MIDTKPSEKIEDFILFFNQLVGMPRAQQRIGASEADIQFLIGIVKYPLPNLYLGYLREFGENDPVLKLGYDGDTRLSEVLEYYEKRTQDFEFEFPNNTALISTQSLTGGRALLYDNKNLTIEPTVVTYFYKDIGETNAKNFRNFLYGRAFTSANYELVSTSEKYKEAVCSINVHLQQEIIEYAISVGFYNYWFSDEFSSSLERDDGVKMLLIVRNRNIEAYIRAPSEEKCKKLVNELIDKFGMRR